MTEYNALDDALTVLGLHMAVENPSPDDDEEVSEARTIDDLFELVNRLAAIAAGLIDVVAPDDDPEAFLRSLSAHREQVGM